MYLFKSADGQEITQNDIINVFDKLNVHKAKILYIHSELSFGEPNINISRNAILSTILDTILSTGVDDILFPTFTFSFINHEDYNVRTSKTLMGALNDYARKDSRGLRSIDPIMSHVHFGKNRTLITDIGKSSCGENSTYHKIEQQDDVLFLFFGIHPSLCFTYSHFIEERLKVPYRYMQSFDGNIIDYHGERYSDTYELFVRCKDVVAGMNPEITKQAYSNGAMKEIQLGNSFIYTYDKDRISEIYIKGIKNDINFMLDGKMPATIVHQYKPSHYPVVSM